MPAVAKKSGSSAVRATDGAQGTLCGTRPSRWNWNSPTTQASAAGSDNVFAENIGLVRKDDAMVSHPDGTPCTTSPIFHAPTLSAYSPNVFVNGKPIGRIGDLYNSDGSYDHAIISGAGTVFANGGGSGLVNVGGSTVYNSSAPGSGFVTIGGGIPNAGVTTREPLNPAPGQPYTVTITGAPDGPVTYTDPSTGQPVTGQVVNGQLSISLVAPTAVIGANAEQAVSFEFADGSVNGGSLVVIPDAMITATQEFIDANPTTWREVFREQYFASIGGDPGDGVIITNPGDWAPGQFWYDYIYQNNFAGSS